MRQQVLLITLLCVALACSRAFAQQGSLADILKAIPLSLKADELQGEWWQMSCGGLQPADPAKAYSPLDAAGGSTYYTRGQMVTLAGETFIVAYRIPADPAAAFFAFNAGAQPAPGLLTPATELALALLNLNTAGSLLDIRPFDLQQATARNTPPLVPPIIPHNQEQTLITELTHLRQALAQFKADTGLFPKQLADLTRMDPPTHGANNAPIPAGTYLGPYLLVEHGIGDLPLPRNPYVDINAADPDPATVETHWKYNPTDGRVSVPDWLAARLTADGKPLREL